MNVKELAKLTNVSESDIMAMVNSMAANIVADGAVENYLEAEQELRTQMAGAYLADTAKKVQSMGEQYLTNTETRDGVNSIVLDRVK